MHGMCLVMVGLLWGFVVPATPFPRLALVAHIQLTVNGMLYCLMGMLLLNVSHQVGPRSIIAFHVSACLTWLMILSQIGNSWWGTTQLLSIAASQAGASGGTPWQEAFVKLTHIASGVGLVVAWGLLMLGMAKTPRTNGNANG